MAKTKATNRNNDSGHGNTLLFTQNLFKKRSNEAIIKYTKQDIIKIIHNIPPTSQHGWSPRDLMTETPLMKKILTSTTNKSDTTHYSTTTKRIQRAKNDKLYLSTYNVRTLLSEDRIYELDEALKGIKWDIIGLAEIRRSSEQLITKENGNIFYHYGETKGQFGVGFYIHKRWKQQILEIKAASERIAILKLKLNKKKHLTIIQAYAPTSAATEEEITAFYSQLETTYEKNKSNLNFVIGDFNCKVGQRIRGEENILGNFCYGSRNKNGNNLVHFAQQQQLKIINSFFKKPTNRQWTWASPDQKTRNQIDYALTNNMKLVKNIDVLNHLKFNSDHKLVRITINVDRASLRAKQINKAHSAQTTNPEKFADQLKKGIEEIDLGQTWTVQELYNEIIDKITSAATESTSTTTTKEERISQETRDLINKRETLKKKTKTKTEIIELVELNKLVKKQIKKDLLNHKHKIVTSIIEKSGSTRKVKKELYTNKQLIPNLKQENGELTHNRKDIIQTATNFYKKLFTSTIENEEKNNLNINLLNTQIPEILPSEIKQAIQEMKNSKSPGEDQIPTEYLKWGAPILVKPLVLLFNLILDTISIPIQWTTSTISLIHKKGSKSQINNYRPITLLNTLYKVFAKVILRRLKPTLHSNQPVEQAGFRSGFSTTDNLHAINQIIEKSREYNFELYIAFIDYEKAFDSIEHRHILKALKDQGIEDKLILLIEEMYKNNMARIKLDKTGPYFRLFRGVRQGDPLSPDLFNAVLESIFQELDWQDIGISVDGKMLTNLRFADDLTLFAKSSEELQTMITSLSDASLKRGLKINFAKTKIMSNTRKNEVRADNSIIEYVEEFTYLGQCISFQENTSKEIQTRIAKSWKAFWAIGYIRDKEIPINLKKKLMDSCILPVLSYGCQTWAKTKREDHQLQVCQRAMERKILQISLKDRIPNTEIRDRTKIRDIITSSRELKWKWAGHVVRASDDRWSTRLTSWIPYDKKRNQGRQPRRWRDELDALDKQWPQLALDRNKWLLKGEAFALQRDT